MSIYALTLATRKKLIKDLKFLEEEVCIGIDGRPPATMGSKAVAIHATNWGPDEVDMNRALSELLSLSVTVTVRIGTIPMDVMENQLYLSGERLTLESILRTCILGIHQNYDILTEANTLIGAATNGFIEPLRWTGGDAQPRIVGSDWFKTGAVDIEDRDNVALVMTQNFGRAKRVQALFDTTRIST